MARKAKEPKQPKKPKKEKKKQEPQYLVSLVNGRVLNYRVYRMGFAEKLLWSLIAFVVGGLAGLVFYGGLFKDDGEATMLTLISNTVVFCGVGIAAAKIYIPMRIKSLRDKRKAELRTQFRDMLESLASSVSAGNNINEAFAGAYRDMCLQYPENAYIVQELGEIMTGINNSIALEDMLRDLGERSGLEDIMNFADVFDVCHRTGGSISDVIRRTYDMISDKLLIAGEIETKLTSNKMQHRVMSVMPVVIVAALRFTNESFAENFASFSGVVSITVAVVIFVIAYRLGEKIIDIKG